MIGEVRPGIWPFLGLVILLLVSSGKIISETTPATNEGKVFTERVCERTIFSISCHNKTLLHIRDVFFGRLVNAPSVAHCVNHITFNTDCSSNRSLEVIRSKCNGCVNCSMWAGSNEFGGDPCSGVKKYLEVNYTCIPESNTTVGQCNNVTTMSPDGVISTSATHPKVSVTIQPQSKDTSTPSENVQKAIGSLEKLSRGESLTGSQISEMTAELVDIIDSIENNSDVSSTIADTITDTVINITSNLLAGALDGLPESNKSSAAARLLSVVEDSAMILAKSINEERTIIKSTSDLKMQVMVVNVSTTPKAIFTSNVSRSSTDQKFSEDSFTIELQGIGNLTSGLGKVVFVLYENIEKFMQPAQLDSQTTNESESSNITRTFIVSRVISASVVSSSESKPPVEIPVQYTLTHKEIHENNSNVSCVFWDYSKKKKVPTATLR